MHKFLPYLLILGLVVSCSTPEPPKVHHGKVALIGNWAPEGLSRRDVWVYTPPNYDTSQVYPVLIMHDGQMLFDSTHTWNHQEWKVDETMDRLINEGKIRPTIVVGIANGEQYRSADYFPGKILDELPSGYRDTLLVEQLQNKSRSDRYIEFLVTEIKPYMREHYSVSEQPGDYFLMGSSMGGLISLYAITEHPEHFGGAACLSTHWPGTRYLNDRRFPEAYFNYLSGSLPNPYASKLYFDHGTVGLDSIYAPLQVKMDSLALAEGFGEASYMSKVYEGHDHNEQAWSERLDVPITFLLGTN